MPGVFIGVASSGRLVDVRWSMSLVPLAHGVPVGMHAEWRIEVGPDRAKNREILAELAVKAGARYLFFLDDDTFCENFTLKSLIYEMEKDPNIMICGGIYTTKEPLPQPLVFKKIGAGPYWAWKKDDVFDCEGLGTGCMMIRCEHLAQIPKPWFLEPHETPKGETMEVAGEQVPVAFRAGTEDLYFCQKVTAAGYRIVAHGGVLPLHMDSIGMLYGLPPDSYPMRKELPNAVDSRNAEIQAGNPALVERPEGDQPEASDSHRDERKEGVEEEAGVPAGSIS